VDTLLASCQDLALWRESFRVGATDELEKNLAALVAKDLHTLKATAHQEDMAAVLEVCTSLTETLKMLKPEIAAPVMQDVTSAATAWQAKAQHTQLTLSIGALCQPSASVMSELATKIRAMVSLSPELHKQLQDLVGCTLTWLGTPEMTTDVPFDDVAAVLSTAKVSHAKPFEELAITVGRLQAAAVPAGGGRV